MLITLAIFLLAWSFATFPGDEQALERIQENQTGWLDAAAAGVTRLGWTPVSISLMAGTIALLFVIRRRADALVVALSGIPIGLGILLKDVIGRARPENFFAGAAPSSFSFPSGHSLFAMLFGGLLIVLIEEMPVSTPIRRGLQAVLVLLILGVGASRVYLGVHWPSDVVGGYLFGIVALVGLVWLRNRLPNRWRARALAGI
ncbi:MAG: hypothetical protein BZY88_18135 [SAR202 cluster bacterium Io17-Chloro-G9]|nr:MAG: hypothetical protein BZY88_18135 [SAR202 cluster bacterium Io17-Chloro-G9]